MNMLKRLSVAAAVAAIGFTVGAPQAQAQVDIGVDVGPAPLCPYGYYDYAPYDCAPYGFYGPEWFLGGAFIGAGPWFHGHDGFRGQVNHHFDAGRGYNGAMPARGEPRHPSNPVDHMEHFSGTEMRDGIGHGFEMGGHEGGHEGGGFGGGGGGGHEGGGGGHR
jgi:hypothetical protein